MLSSSREEIVEVFDALDAVVSRACELSFEALTTPERLRLLERLERVTRRLPVPQHGLINQLAEQADETSCAPGCPGHWPIAYTSPAVKPTGGRPRRPISASGGP